MKFEVKSAAGVSIFNYNLKRSKYIKPNITKEVSDSKGVIYKMAELLILDSIGSIKLDKVEDDVKVSMLERAEKKEKGLTKEGKALARSKKKAEDKKKAETNK